MQLQNNIKFVLEDNQTEQLFDMETNIHLQHKGQNYLVGVLKHQISFFLLENQPDCIDEDQIISFIKDESLINELLMLCPEDLQLRYNQQNGNTNIIHIKQIKK